MARLSERILIRAAADRPLEPKFGSLLAFLTRQFPLLQGRSPTRTVDDGLLRSVMGLRGRAEEPPAPAPGSPGKGGDRAALRIAPPQVVAEWDAGRPVVGLHWLSSGALAAACDLGPRTRLTFHDVGGVTADRCPACQHLCELTVATQCRL